MPQDLHTPPALILIDIQKGFDHHASYGGERNNPDAENNARRLLDHWRKNEWPLFHIQHCSVQPGSPLAPGQPGNDFKILVQPLPGETVIQKDVNSAFIGTDLQAQLDRGGIHTVVIAGLTTQHCISTTARMAGNFGYKTFVVSDATAAFSATTPDGKTLPAQLVHEVSLATIHREFATVLPTAEVLESIEVLETL